jgi:hypothetical protein
MLRQNITDHVACMGEIFKSTNVGRSLKCRHYLDDLGVIRSRSITLSYNSKSLGFEVGSLNWMELVQERF